MKSETDPATTPSDDPNDPCRRVTTPPLSTIEKRLLKEYCKKFHHKLGPGLLMAGMREICRELGLPDIPPPQPSAPGT